MNENSEDLNQKIDVLGHALGNARHLGGAKRFKNKYTDEIWEVSDTRHSDKTGEWKVGLNGDLPNRNKKITIGRSDGKFIKIDNK